MSPSAQQAAWLIRCIDGTRYLAEDIDRDGDAIRFVGYRADKRSGPCGPRREYVIPVGRLRFARRAVTS